MFGNTYPIVGSGRLVSERLGGSGLADFVRLEFRPADQPSVMLSLRRAAVKERRRGRSTRGLVRRFRPRRATPSAGRGAVTGAHCRPPPSPAPPTTRVGRRA